MAHETTTDAASLEARLRKAEEALRETLEERNRLWGELQRRNANQHELDHYRQLYEGQTDSVSWRITLPLRVAAALWRDPAGALKRLVRRVRDYRA
jgi:hypothetical protein